MKCDTTVVTKNGKQNVAHERSHRACDPKIKGKVSQSHNASDRGISVKVMDTQGADGHYLVSQLLCRGAHHPVDSIPVAQR